MGNGTCGSSADILCHCRGRSVEGYWPYLWEGKLFLLIFFLPFLFLLSLTLGSIWENPSIGIKQWLIYGRLWEKQVRRRKLMFSRDCLMGSGQLFSQMRSMWRIMQQRAMRGLSGWLSRFDRWGGMKWWNIHWGGKKWELCSITRKIGKHIQIS